MARWLGGSYEWKDGEMKRDRNVQKDSVQKEMGHRLDGDYTTLITLV